MQIATASRENAKEFDTVFAITEAIMGFVPNSMLIMARDPELLAAFAELSAIILVRPGRLNPGFKALIMYMVSRSAGCQYCAAHSANLAALRDIPIRKIEALGQFEQSPEFSEAERAALRFAQAAGQVPNAVGNTEFAELRRHFDDDQILEMVAVLALLSFLNRWNDTLATTLEAGPRNFAECHLAADGWKVGKHADTIPLDPQPRRSISLSARLFLWLLRRWRPRTRPSKYNSHLSNGHPFGVVV
ncbi:carboxymuconolactone decarboxylase family protein [Edaphobacter aggregans]|uniref:carboxymuconolactone decarboxylase family protein n=1 Tax=Edaphobacter aggregans TaxID=570835 RepID=UPI0007E8DAE6|nr:carboxymuconolactone decarboxylase family protein [Edaphobacter aggregans]